MKQYLPLVASLALATVVLVALASLPPAPPRLSPTQQFKKDCEAKGRKYVYTVYDGHLCLK